MPDLGTPLGIMARHIRRIVPVADAELDRWERRAATIPDPALARLAESSIASKRFHCQGGSVFAAWRPDRARELVRFIVAFQTISDYLDNLGDRSDSLSERDFRTLHLAMIEAVDVFGAPCSDYYRYHPHKRDGGYLRDLVGTCREALLTLGVRERTLRAARTLIELYVDLQSLKHLPKDMRIGRLQAWFQDRGGNCPNLYWWEFAAAAGSTLGVFALVADASGQSPKEDDERLLAAYFPWIGGLHILLDYLIDQEEDRIEGDLNFVSFYCGERQATERMRWMLRNAVERTDRLADPGFHRTVILGLLGLYLSDGKVARHGRLRRQAVRLIRAGGMWAWCFWLTCHGWRRVGRRSDERRNYREGMTS